MRLFSHHKGKEIFWFRIFGYGLCFNKTIKFSQRIGKSKYLKIGDCIITTLKPVI